MLLGKATADCSMGGVMAELLCLSTQTMWLEVRWRAKYDRNGCSPTQK